MGIEHSLGHREQKSRKVCVVKTRFSLSRLLLTNWWDKDLTNLKKQCGMRCFFCLRRRLRKEEKNNKIKWFLKINSIKFHTQFFIQLTQKQHVRCATQQNQLTWSIQQRSWTSEVWHTVVVLSYFTLILMNCSLSMVFVVVCPVSIFGSFFQSNKTRVTKMAEI